MTTKPLKNIEATSPPPEGGRTFFNRRNRESVASLRERLRQSSFNNLYLLIDDLHDERAQSSSQPTS
jgi:hypothetical protein